MLIVAIPKSASTSLLNTLSELHGLDGFQCFSVRDNPLPDSVAFLHNAHSDIRELRESDVERFAAEGVLYKQHIFPTENNLRLTSQLKKIILLRDPMEIVLAYRRGAKRGVHDLLKGFSLDMTEEEWVRHADNCGLINDLQVFHQRWEDQEGNLIVTYNDLVSCFENVIRNIESFWGLEATSCEIQLSKARYSRHNIFERAVIGTKRFTGSVLKKMGLR